MEGNLDLASTPVVMIGGISIVSFPALNLQRSKNLLGVFFGLFPVSIRAIHKFMLMLALLTRIGGTQFKFKRLIRSTGNCVPECLNAHKSIHDFATTHFINNGNVD